MIKLEQTAVSGWMAAIRGMRNPMNSWEKSDTLFKYDDGPVAYDITGTPVQMEGDGFGWEGRGLEHLALGTFDEHLMLKLARAGSVDAKYRRMINVTVDITAPLYWWKEYDTYKIGTVANSCSTMHKIHAKEFTLGDFSHEHLLNKSDLLKPDERFDIDDDIALSAVNVDGNRCYFTPDGFLQMTCDILNRYRTKFLETKDKKYWWQMIQLLPSSYNQKRTVQLNYEVLAGIYPKRKNHKLDEWHEFCDWIKDLPYSDIITLEVEEND